jgi:hypothetical protein
LFPSEQIGQDVGDGRIGHGSIPAVLATPALAAG